jgi:hypothetical protein
MSNMGGETSISKTVVWLTPPHILAALGEFDLDPCASLDRPWDTARNHFTVEDNGLVQDWFGRVWMNPPYGPGMDKWLNRLANHPEGGIALVFARTETRAFFDAVWGKADAMLFLKGRLKFHFPDGRVGDTAQSPSVLIAYGAMEKAALRNCGLAGQYVDLAGSVRVGNVSRETLGEEL